MMQYGMMLDVYKFHFEIVLKLLIFYYAVSGGILSYYLSQPNKGFTRYALVLPVFMSIVLGVFAFLGASQVNPMGEDIVRVTGDLQLDPFPSMKLLEHLKSMLLVAGFLSFGICIALTWVSFARETPPGNPSPPTSHSSAPVTQSPSP